MMLDVVPNLRAVCRAACLNGKKLPLADVTWVIKSARACVAVDDANLQIA